MEGKVRVGRSEKGVRGDAREGGVAIAGGVGG